MTLRNLWITLLALAIPALTQASYENFEASQVHPLALTPDGSRLLAVNTPDAVLEVFTVRADGYLVREPSIPVGLEPVSVVVMSDREAWVVNQLSDSVSVVDLARGEVRATLLVGDEPSDVAFAGGRAFVSVSGEDVIKVYDPAALGVAPVQVPLLTKRPRALAVANDDTLVYAVALFSGSETTTLHANVIFGNNSDLDPARLAAFGLNDIRCTAPAPAYPPLPPGVIRNPALTDPVSGIPPVGLIVHWDGGLGQWLDDAGRNWNMCLPFRLPDHDLFAIDVATLAVTEVDHVGTSLFEVSVQPTTGKIYIPLTSARNAVRFEHPLGLQGHVVDNQVAVVDPSLGYAKSIIDLNGHIDRMSDPNTNLAEREASVSQPGMMTWRSDGSTAYLSAIGSRRLFALDGSCTAATCIFGPDRAAPRAANVAPGVTGVALHEASDRLFVLNRFANTITTFDATALVAITALPLHDPSGTVVQAGRPLLYDAALSSGHGDAACSSCHISGDLDGLAWDLGDPRGDFVPYANVDDNIRFIAPIGGAPAPCDPSVCGAHQGFDPQKGPMTTQTFRGMLEPLHWRGDRATFSEFNPAFVGLLGRADRGPVSGKPTGLSPAEMAAFRQFVLAIRFPPNPLRELDDTLVNAQAPIPGTGLSGNPTIGATLFDNGRTDPEPCAACHAHPFGAAGGRIGGVTPSEPTSPMAAALFNGTADKSPHSDLKVPHLRNMYQKMGPRFGTQAGPAQAASGFGFSHDGSIPDLLTFLSINVFTLTESQVRDIASFVVRFPTGTRPCVGAQLTLPQGAPPTGSPSEEARLATLLTIADAAAPSRHGELVASTLVSGRMQNFRLASGNWIPDIAAEPGLSTTALRLAAGGPITFLCTPDGSGSRLGGDRDEDGYLNGDDCAPDDATTWAATSTVSGLAVTTQAGLGWIPQTGPGLGTDLAYEIVGGNLATLRTAGLAGATQCVQGDLGAPTWQDARPDPPPGDGWYYIVRARNRCGPGDFGPGRAAIETLDCRGR